MESFPEMTSTVATLARTAGIDDPARTCRSSQRRAVSLMTGITSVALAPSSSCAAIIAVISPTPPINRGSVSPAARGYGSTRPVPSACATPADGSWLLQRQALLGRLGRRRRPLQRHFRCQPAVHAAGSGPLPSSLAGNGPRWHRTCRMVSPLSCLREPARGATKALEIRTGDPHPTSRL
jgi:hypothetical protein